MPRHENRLLGPLGTFTTARIEATVKEVLGNRIVLAISSAEAPPRVGYCFALHDGRRYKGEAVLEEIRPDGTATAVVRLRVEDQVIRVGDVATTNPG